MSITQQGYKLIHTGIDTWDGVTNAAPDANQTAIAIQTASGDFVPFASTNYRIVKTDGKTASENGTALLTALSQCYALTPNESPLSASNRAVLFLFNGEYDLGSSFLQIDQYVDIISFADSIDTLITSSNSTGTIQVSSTNDYALKNLTIDNSGSGGSIITSGSDSGKWSNIILNKNTSGSTYNGIYTYISSSAEVLNGDINGEISNCDFGNNSCGYSLIDGLTISGNIVNCTGGQNCFGSTYGGDLIIAGSIKNCIAGNNSLGYCDVNTVTITGTIQDCFGQQRCFGSSDGSGNVTITGTIVNCESSQQSFGCCIGTCLIDSSAYIANCVVNDIRGFGWSNQSTVTINGIIENCTSGDNSFGACDSATTCTITGTIINCFSRGGQSFCFSNQGSVSMSGIIRDCIAGENQNFATAQINCTIDGLIDNCIIQSNGSNSFGYTFSGLVEVNGTIRNCSSGINSFANTDNGSVQMNGLIENCTGTSACFGSTSTTATISNSGTFKNCTGTTMCFGNTTIDARLISCRRESDFGLHAAIIENCIFTDNSNDQSLLLDTGATVRYCTITNTSGGNSIAGNSLATNVSIYLCSLNNAPDGGTITNLVALPNNVIDSNVVA